jgi:hypothetical protein
VLRILVCIDDTDSLESKGTGAHALDISQRILQRGWGYPKFISRHQLYVHEDIPYTSHNSAMCFEVDNVEGEDLAGIKDLCMDYLERESADGSDPGLCIVELDKLTGGEGLMQFGKKAKQAVLTKKEAYETAERLCVHLSEHGGTGGGVIGALAGAGLRLGGNDGRIKGKYFVGRQGEVLAAEEILQGTNIDEIREENGEALQGQERVMLGEKVKAVLMEGKVVLLVERTDGDLKNGAKWATLPKSKLRKY